MLSISVLMSVYNETESELRQSIESVLNQTFNDFEFIIVNDNPSNSVINKVINEYVNLDSRIKILINETNIGLAESMNKAASIAKGRYYLRTDADDICELSRFEKQYKIISENGYDIVFSDYFVINENGDYIEKGNTWFDSYTIKKLLPFENIIHHPTVIMKASSFNKINGYRNFLCAQDYDLWLRMVLENYSFYMMRDKLLMYRVRTASTTSRKKFMQICTLNYIMQLYDIKKKTDIDSYSYNEYLKYLENNGVFDLKKRNDFMNSLNLYQEGVKELKRKMVFSGTKKILLSLKRSNKLRITLKRKIKYITYSKLLKLLKITRRQALYVKKIN